MKMAIQMFAKGLKVKVYLFLLVFFSIGLCFASQNEFNIILLDDPFIEDTDFCNANGGCDPGFYPCCNAGIGQWEPCECVPNGENPHCDSGGPGAQSCQYFLCE